MTATRARFQNQPVVLDGNRAVRARLWVGCRKERLLARDRHVNSGRASNPWSFAIDIDRAPKLG
jgi:hypothetical protein